MFFVTVELISIRENIKAATKVDIWEKFKRFIKRELKKRKMNFQKL